METEPEVDFEQWLSKESVTIEEFNQFVEVYLSQELPELRKVYDVSDAYKQQYFQELFQVKVDDEDTTFLLKVFCNEQQFHGFFKVELIPVSQYDLEGGIFLKNWKQGLPEYFKDHQYVFDTEPNVFMPKTDLNKIKTTKPLLAQRSGKLMSWQELNTDENKKDLINLCQVFKDSVLEVKNIIDQFPEKKIISEAYSNLLDRQVGSWN